MFLDFNHREWQFEIKFDLVNFAIPNFYLQLPSSKPIILSTLLGIYSISSTLRRILTRLDMLLGSRPSMRTDGRVCYDLDLEIGVTCLGSIIPQRTSGHPLPHLPLTVQVPIH